VYRDLKSGQADPLKVMLGGLYTVFQNKYYFDEFYHATFVRFSQWVSEIFSYRWIDRTIIDGFLHTIARVAFFLGGVFRDRFELPVISGGADWLGGIVQWFGHTFRTIQSGRVQQYMILVLVNVIAFGFLFYYLLEVVGR
jgi:NADH-quinone oxidoreductase subunit L